MRKINWKRVILTLLFIVFLPVLAFLALLWMLFAVFCMFNGVDPTFRIPTKKQFNDGWSSFLNFFTKNETEDS